MLKKKIPQRLTSTLLAFVMLITSIPFMSWSAIAQTVVPAILAAQDDSVAETAADVSTAETSDISVNYPTNSNLDKNYVSRDDGINDYGKYASGDAVQGEKNFDLAYEVWAGYGVFDAKTYIQLNPDLIDNDTAKDYYATYGGTSNTVTYYHKRLFDHCGTSGKYEGRVASPFFCIECYLKENSDLYEAYYLNIINANENERLRNAYKLAWEHFENNCLKSTGGEKRVLSPIFHTEDYRELNPDAVRVLGNPTNGALITHFMTSGRNAWDIRSASKRVDVLSYFYNHNSIYHTDDGVMECYRLLIRELSATESTTGTGCKHHNGKTYLPGVNHETFTGTLTSVGTMKNIALGENDSLAAETPSNAKNQLWQFVKNDVNTYYIKLAESDAPLTHEGESTADKYLCAYPDLSGIHCTISSTPISSWNVQEKDGFYIIHPIVTGDKTCRVLNISDNGEINITNFGNPVQKDITKYDPTSTAYTDTTMNQRFIINTTYDSPADSDGLAADFYAKIDAFSRADSPVVDTKVSLTPGFTFLRTRATVDDTHPAADQVWHFIRQNDGTYNISNTANGLYLTSKTGGYGLITNDILNIENKSGNYASVYVEGKDNSDYQKWIVLNREDGGYFIMPVVQDSNFNQGTYLQQAVNQQELNAGSHEHLLFNDHFKTGTYARQSVFDITPVDDVAYAVDLEGSGGHEVAYYATLSSAKKEYSDYYLQNSVTQKTEAVLQEGFQKKHDFYWNFERRVDGSYRILSTTTINYCLTVEDNDLYLAEYDVASVNDQLWYVFKYNGGGYKIQHKRSGKVLQMDANGNLTLAFDNGDKYDNLQLFNIKETDMSIDTAADTFKVNLFNYGHYINQPGAVLDFTYHENDALDRRSLNIAAGSVVAPEMSKVLDSDGYPYVKNYAFAHRKANSKVPKNNVDYEDRVIDETFLTPNYGTSGSLKYLFNENAGFVRGGKDDSVTEYNPTAKDGDLYQSQSFKVKNPSGLFKKDNYGFYCYDSAENSAYLDIDEDSKKGNSTMSGTFKVYDYLTHVSGNAPLEKKFYHGMFLPFNIAHEQGVLSYDADTVYESGNVINYQDERTKANKANYTLSKLNRTKENDYTNELTTGYTTDRTKVSDLWFGMSLETDFYQTKGGMLDDEAVRFEFAGDDNVWVYLDGVLVLSNPSSDKCEINFANSTYDVTELEECTYAGETIYYADGTPIHKFSSTAEPKKASIYSAYYAAYEEVTGDQQAKLADTIARSFVKKNGDALSANSLPAPSDDYKNDPVYKEYEEHNLKFFYLERGGAASNCHIRLNTLSGGTTVSKEVENLNEEVMDKSEYKFQAVYVDENEYETPVANSPYTLSSTSTVALTDDGVSTVSDEYKTDENGCFTLKANQKAIFKKIPLGSNIKIREIVKDEEIKTRWATYESGEKKNGADGTQTDVITVPVDKTLDVVFTNDYEPSQDVTIHKIFNIEDSSENYKPSDKQVYVIGYEILDKSDNVIVKSKLSLHAGEKGVIEDIPVGYSYRVWEYVPEGKLSYESPVFKKNNEEEQTKLFVAQGAEPSVDSYVEGDSVLGADDEIYITNKLVKLGSMAVTFKYYNRKRVDGAPAQINTYPASYKKTLKAEDWDDYINQETQRVNFSKLIADQGILFNGTVGVDNIIDEYQVWTSQAEAEELFAQQDNYFAEKNADGTYKKYGETNPNDLAYHTNAFGEIANDGEKWVTYYKGGTVLDPEKQGNDTEVTNITVWLFNRPKEYTATLHTIDPKNVTTAIYKSEKDILIGTDKIEFKAFYNQRIGNATDSESSESDAETLNKYLGVYKISDSDVVKGKNQTTGADEDVYYVDMPQTVTRKNDANSEPYSFLYWSYDEDGQFVASTSINYAYRITNDITLYAVYGKTGLQFPGLTSFKNGIDFYYNGSGVGQVRLNTMMNPYNCPDNDEAITEAAIMYVMLHGSDEYKGKSQDELLGLLLQDSGNGYGMTNLDVLREDIRRILLKEMTRAVATQKFGQVTVIDVEITASGFKYYVENADGTDSSALNLTTKNRLQFTTEFTRDKLNGKHMLAFTAMKRNNSWIVSDNYVDYNFVNVFNFE